MKTILLKHRKLIIAIFGILFMLTVLMPISAFAVGMQEMPNPPANVTEAELLKYSALINERIDEAYQSLGIETVTVKDYCLLKDFDEDEPTFISVNFNPSGYAIFNRVAMQVMERTPSGNSPYLSKSELDCYYGGYTMYFYKSTNKYYYLNTDVELDEETEETLKSQSAQAKIADYEKYLAIQSAKRARGAANRENRPTYISNYTYFTRLNTATTGNRFTWDYGTKDSLFGDNRNNSCSQVAAGMLLQYYDRKGIRDLVPNDLTTSTLMNKAYINNEYYGNDSYQMLYNTQPFYKTNAEALHQILRFCTFPSPNEGQYGTTIEQLKSGLQTYFSLGSYAGVSVTTANQNGMKNLVRSAVDSGQPAIISTLVNTYVYKYPNASGYYQKNIGAHTVVAYGYTRDIFNNMDEYVTHFGWYDGKNDDNKDTNYAQVYLNSNFPATNHGALRLNF